VKLTFTVDKRGRAKAITVADSSPEKVFEQAAKSALRKRKFEVLPGHNTTNPLVQTFDFALHPSDDRQSSRNRRCNTTGSNIRGMFYRQETVEKYGPQAVRTEASNKK
jgi:TonB family protein